MLGISVILNTIQINTTVWTIYVCCVKQSGEHIHMLIALETRSSLSFCWCDIPDKFQLFTDIGPSIYIPLCYFCKIQQSNREQCAITEDRFKDSVTADNHYYSNQFQLTTDSSDDKVHGI